MAVNNKPLIEQYSSIINNADYRKDTCSPDDDLLLWKNDSKKLSCYYAPFDHVNSDAQIIIVGITPGRTQMNRSLNAFKQATVDGMELNPALQSIKQHASLSGTMRPRIIKMLNKLGYPAKLNIDCSSSLWSNNNHLVHFCSLLKYPIFINGKDYSGQPKLLNTISLKELLYQEFIKDISSINSQAIIVPLGEMVADVLSQLNNDGIISQKLMTYQNKVVAPPHPSGANAESIALLLADDYPTLAQYQQQMYQAYLDKKNWLKKSQGQPQNEQNYKKARASRWNAIYQVRQAYGL